MDYKNGQAKQLFSELSPEIQEAIEKAQDGFNHLLEKIKTWASGASDSINEFIKKNPSLEKLKQSLTDALKKVKESSIIALEKSQIWILKASDEIELLSEKVPLGDKTLADVLFASRRKVGFG